MKTRNIFVIVCLIISYSAVSWGDTRYVFMPGKVRTFGPAASIPPGMPWSGSRTDDPPKIPGVKSYFDSIKIISAHGAMCMDYPNQERGNYRRPDGTIHFYYPWTRYVKNCDISRFLYCKTEPAGGSEGICRCFPGYYWSGDAPDAPDGRCLAGYLQRCTTFKAYDFQIKPICGEGMQCVTDSGGVEEHCVCYQNIAGRSFTGVMEKDAIGQEAKYYCPLNPSAAPGKDSSCSEYRGKQWVLNNPSAPKGMGRFKLINVTKTGCGDDGTGVQNVYCRFPKDQTGPNPTKMYGQRDNGKCVCTDSSLSYLAGRGCFPKVNQACKDGMVAYKGRKPGEKNITDIKGECGPYAMCSESSGVCVCKTDGSGKSYKTDGGGQCSPTATGDDGSVGMGKLVGSFCNDTDPCYQRGGQQCLNQKCVCMPLYFTATDKCKGLYGVPCDDISGCVDDGGFECVTVPELTSVRPSARVGQKYCVCKQFHLNTMTGRCGAESLTPTELGVLALIAIFLQRIPKMSN